MKKFPEGNSIVYCEGAFNTPNGKTAHGLVRFTKRYNVQCVIDSKYSGKDSGLVLDGKENNIPVFSNLAEAIPAEVNLPDSNPAGYCTSDSVTG